LSAATHNLSSSGGTRYSPPPPPHHPLSATGRRPGYDLLLAGWTEVALSAVLQQLNQHIRRPRVMTSGGTRRQSLGSRRAPWRVLAVPGRLDEQSPSMAGSRLGQVAAVLTEAVRQAVE